MGCLELLATVSDPRERRGIRHGLAGVLAVAGGGGRGREVVRGDRRMGR